MGQTGGHFLKISTKDPLGIGQANCFRAHNELTMGLLGKYPLAPSVLSLGLERTFMEATISGCLPLNLEENFVVDIRKTDTRLWLVLVDFEHHELGNFISSIIIKP